MSKINILYGLEAASGGALKHLTYLVTHLSKEKFDITVILSNLRKDIKEHEINQIKSTGVKLIFLPIKREICFSDLIILYKLFIYIRNNKFHIVHAHSSKAGVLFRIAGKLNQVPLILYTPHCFYFQSKQGLKKWFFITIERIIGKITDGIIVSDNELIQLKENRIVPLTKSNNINNAIDFNECKQNLLEEKTKDLFKIPSNSKVVTAIGRLTKQKDWTTFIYAANEVLKVYPDVFFLIVGEGELYYDLKKLVLELKIQSRIILTGYVADVYKIFGITDIYVNTSLWEGLPYVLLEAMHYKKPIITTNPDGERGIIIDTVTGLTSPVKDYKTIAQKILLLLKDRILAENLANNINAILPKKYSFEYFIREHENLYLKTKETV